MKVTANKREYIIPKGTRVVGNIYGASRDGKQWGEPNKGWLDEFNIDKWIDKNTGKFVMHPTFVTFGLGRRGKAYIARLPSKKETNKNIHRLRWEIFGGKGTLWIRWVLSAKIQIYRTRRLQKITYSKGSLK